LGVDEHQAMPSVETIYLLVVRDQLGQELVWNIELVIQVELQEVDGTIH
jgi:hypothetical protein